MTKDKHENNNISGQTLTEYVLLIVCVVLGVSILYAGLTEAISINYGVMSSFISLPIP
jgi:hypothetical protein